MKCTDCQFFRPYSAPAYAKEWPNGGHCMADLTKNSTFNDFGVFLSPSAATMTVRAGDKFFCAAYKEKE